MGAVGVRISTYVITEGSLLEQTVPQNPTPIVEAGLV